MTIANNVIQDTDKTTSKTLLSHNNFDIIRLFAAFEVALKHSLVHLGFNNSFVDILGLLPGVPIFYFISGYLIYQSFVNAPNIKTFAFNRIVRIYPALVTCLLFSIALVISVGFLPLSKLGTLSFFGWFLAQISFVQFYNPEFLRSFGTGSLNGSLWTISVELQFYLLTPFIYFLARNRRWLWPILTALFVIPNIIFTAMPDEAIATKLLMVTFAPWVYMFLLGAWLSSRSDLQKKLLRFGLAKTSIAYVVILLLSWVFGLSYFGNNLNPMAYCVLAALVFNLAFTNGGVANKLLGRNDISYGVYIYHMPIVNLMLFYGLTGAFWVAFVIGATFMLAALSWKLIEKPALMLKRSALRRV